MNSAARPASSAEPATAADAGQRPPVRKPHRANQLVRRISRIVHQNRYLAGIVEMARSRQCDRRFTAHLVESIGAATQWRSAQDVREFAYGEVLRLQSVTTASTKKGAPSIPRIRADDLSYLAAALQPGAAQPLGKGQLAAAAKIASLDPADAGAFSVYLAVLWLINAKVIAALRESLPGRIAVHVTCLPRLHRAERSIENFATGVDCQLAHVKVVGTGDGYAFDTDRQLLGVPSADNYESLPAKIFRAFAILALACNPQSLLKLDDDHRLLDAKALDKLLRSAATAHDPVQYGEVNRVALPSSHHRAWHFGKCANPEVGARVLEMPTPRRWATGEAGYILNRPAIWRVLWGSLYYSRWLDEILYEDVALAELAARTGIRVVSTQMSYAVTTTSDY